MNVKILLVDDHPMLRNGLRSAISQHPNFTLAGEASSSAEALKAADELAPELVVMDVHLTGVNGIETARLMIASHPAIKIIMFSSDASRAIVDDALQSGACGYILKKGAVEELLQAIEVVMTGKLYLSPEVSAGIMEDYRKGLNDDSPPAKPLISDRDRELLRLVAEGRRNKEIAAQLSISIKSVEAYRSRLMKKLNFSSAAELVRYAIREGIAAP